MAKPASEQDIAPISEEKICRDYQDFLVKLQTLAVAAIASRNWQPVYQHIRSFDGCQVEEENPPPGFDGVVEETKDFKPSDYARLVI